MLTQIIPSYPYVQYNDDENIVAFFDAYNQLAQNYLNWFNTISLPIYTGLTGDLLDWVAQGLYGMARPSLPVGYGQIIGPLNTFGYNERPFNSLKRVGPSNVYLTTDDTFKRILTWHFYKADGRYFTISWLKRRIMRFLTDSFVDQTYQISVTFGYPNQVNIRLISGNAVLAKGALFNTFGFNRSAFNAFMVQRFPLVPLPNVAILKAAIDAGVLELPFQFQYVVILG